MVTAIWRLNEAGEKTLVFEEPLPGSTFATKVLGVVTEDETSNEVMSLHLENQADQNRLTQEGFHSIPGCIFWPEFVER